MFKPSSLMARRAAILLPLVLLFALLLAAPAWATVEGLDVTLDDYTVGAATPYYIAFSATGGLNPGNEIAVTFDTGFTISSAATARIVYQGTPYTPAYVVVQGTVVKIGVPSTLTVGTNGPVELDLSGVTNPTRAWDLYTIALTTTLDPTAATYQMSFVPGPPAKVVVQGIEPNAQVVAGATWYIWAAVTDVYDNLGLTVSNVVYVNLSDNDPQPNFGAEQTATVWIDANQSFSNSVAWTPKTAGPVPATPGQTTITAKDAANQLQSGSLTIQVVPDAPSQIADLEGPKYLDLNQQGTYTFNLRDQFGNLAAAPSGGLSPFLSANPSSGVTLNPNPVTVQEGAYSGSFTFRSTVPGVFTVSACDSSCSSVTVVVGLPCLSTLAVSAPPTGEVGKASEITITLKDQFGNIFAAPSNGVLVTPTTDNTGTFQSTDGSTITGIFIPAGYTSAKIYYIPATEGTHKLAFTAPRLTTTGGSLGENVSVSVEVYVNPNTGADGAVTLAPGWNIISTPWVLADGKDTVGAIVYRDDVEQAWGYAEGKWFEVAPDTPLRPLEAVFVKVRKATQATFWAKRGLNTPPVRSLVTGWNLVGNPADKAMAVNEALSTISGKYAAVVSPTGCNQAGWVYTPLSWSIPSMEKFRGYWVYTTESTTLAGLATPPVE